MASIDNRSTRESGFLGSISWFFLFCFLIAIPSTESSFKTPLFIETFDYEFDPTIELQSKNISEKSSNINTRSFYTKPNYAKLASSYLSKTSPYQVIPGSYASKDLYSYYKSPSLYNQVSIFSDYLSGGPFLYYSPYCQYNYGKIPKIHDYDLQNAFNYASNQLRVKFPEYSNETLYKDTDRKEIEGRFMELASEYFGRFKCLSKYQLGTYLPLISIKNDYLILKNKKNIDLSCLSFYNDKNQCSSYSTSKYRTFDGSCNNLKFPYWGRSFTCHIRLLPPDYSDGIQALRMSKYGSPLPNPRKISNYVTASRNLKAYYTSLLLSWGQFINHDISETGTHLEDDYHKIDCCLGNHSHTSYKCTSLQFSDPNDYLVQSGTRCLNMIRSTPCPICKLGPREQTNTVSSFIDASHVYGATLKASNELRTFQKGQLLAVANKYGQAILPPSPPGFSTCMPANPRYTCFKSGDNRVNQNPILMSMHTIMMRNHNYHAYQLSLVNPRWNDERLFQEARRIVIAEIQHITMNEYLPVILGPILMQFYRLVPKQQGFTQYQSYTDPSTWNEFVAAASRYGHSQIKDFYHLFNLNYANSSFFALKDNFFEPGFAHDGLIDNLIRGLVSDPSDPIDPYYSETAKNYVVKRKNKPHGLDMVTTNVQRGRDHGIPGYPHYLKACFNYPVKDWSDLEKFIPRETLLKLKTMYSTIDDIDLYIGGMSERHFIDAAIGPTFGCLVGIQYYHIKYGDRFFYEHGSQSGSFTLAQLNSIRQATTMSKLLCRNAKTLDRIQSRPFYVTSRLNQPVDCRNLPEINYLLWKE